MIQEAPQSGQSEEEARSPLFWWTVGGGVSGPLGGGAGHGAASHVPF